MWPNFFIKTNHVINSIREHNIFDYVKMVKLYNDYDDGDDDYANHDKHGNNENNEYKSV